jgi:hypothetical protein
MTTMTTEENNALGNVERPDLSPDDIDRLALERAADQISRRFSVQTSVVCMANDKPTLWVIFTKQNPALVETIDAILALEHGVDQFHGTTIVTASPSLVSIRSYSF